MPQGQARNAGEIQARQASGSSSIANRQHAQSMCCVARRLPELWMKHSSLSFLQLQTDHGRRLDCVDKIPMGNALGSCPCMSRQPQLQLEVDQPVRWRSLFFAKYLPVLLFVTYIWEPTLTPRLHAIAVQLCRLVSVGKCNRHPSGQIQGYREVTLHDCDYGPILAPGYFCSSPCDTTQRQSHPSLKKKLKKTGKKKYCSTIGR